MIAFVRSVGRFTREDLVSQSGVVQLESAQNKVVEQSQQVFSVFSSVVTMRTASQCLFERFQLFLYFCPRRFTVEQPFETPSPKILVGQIGCRMQAFQPFREPRRTGVYRLDRFEIEKFVVILEHIAVAIFTVGSGGAIDALEGRVKRLLYALFLEIRIHVEG